MNYYVLIDDQKMKVGFIVTKNSRCHNHIMAQFHFKKIYTVNVESTADSWPISFSKTEKYIKENESNNITIL